MKKSSLNRWSAFVASALLLMCLISTHAAHAADNTVWLEGEAPTSHNMDFKPSAWDGGVMSGDNWLQVNVDKDKSAAQLPKEGAIFGYQFAAPSAGHYQLWNRIGFEFVRSDFDWRLDNGEWKTIKANDITTDLTEIGYWAEVAWIKMGESDLTAGPHNLEIRLPNNGEKVFYSSDALVISKGEFRPNGKYRPDASWQTDEDKAAAAKVFPIKAAQGAAQTSTSLAGNWQFARWDEMLVENRTDPIKSLPNAADLYWRSINVPGNRNDSLKDMTFAHRYFLRTRVEIPQADIGRSYYLHFPSVNMIASVFVNGQQCGTTKTPFAVWDCDISKAVKPGVNEIWVGIKDTYYGLAPNDGKNVRYSFQFPTGFVGSNQGTTMMLDFPVAGRLQTGILVEPTLVSAGPTYISDVFAIPSLKNKDLGLEITLKNPTDQAMTVRVGNDVMPLSGGKAEKSFAAKDVAVAAHSEQVVKLSEAWANPKLWWPDEPNQYNVVTRLVVNGQTMDERTTKFGFREWDWNGWDFKLNGVPWHGRADLSYNDTDKPEEAVKVWKQHGQTMFRLWSQSNWGNLSGYQQALDFFDAHGVPVRRTGIFDGQGANYGLTEEVEQDGKKVRVARRALYDNWRDQLVAQVKGERNHPSVFVWSMENELTFINANVFGLNQTNDPEMKRAAEALAAIDPTRPQMVDGGNALLDQSLPIYGGHYLEVGFEHYPAEAYTLTEMFKAGAPGNFQRWPITKDKPKPILIGESFYANGTDLGAFASIAGESAFIGKAQAAPAVGLFGKMLSEGYRWSGVNFHFWAGGESNLYYNSWQPIAVLCRQWDWSFGSGQAVPRTFGLFNDTRIEQPISFTWTLNVGGKKAASQTAEYKLAPGSNQKFDTTITMPVVPSRQDGELVLTLAVGGKEVFKDVKPLDVLNTGVLVQSPLLLKPVSAQMPGAPTLETRVSFQKKPVAKPASKTAATAPANLFVYDPNGNVGAFLKARGTAFTALADLNTLPPTAKVLIVGKDALDATESTSSRLAAYAAGGRAVIVLEQQNPLKYQALPAEMPVQTNQGRIGFSEDLDNPIFKDLRQSDFFTWAPDGVLYRNAYLKPTSGGKSLVQVGMGLQDTALAEVPVGQGLLLLSQLTIGEKLGQNAVAQQLLSNLIAYGQNYKLTFRPVALVSDDAQLIKAVDATGLQTTKAPDVLAAIAKPGAIALISATPANLQTLASNMAKVNAFTAGGGWLVFNNLTPDGLSDYNKIVGFDHMIRPFRRERVTFPPVRNPLTAGLSTSNIVMNSGEQIFPWAAGEYVAADAFSYVVDFDDVAPFGKSDNFLYENAVNNFVNADGWKLINNFAAPAKGPAELKFTLPKPQTIQEFTWVGDTNYTAVTQVGLRFDGKDEASFPTPPDSDPHTFAVTPPRAGQEITILMSDEGHPPDKSTTIGIDNIYLKAQRPADFYQKVKPMLNIGAMMDYPRGAGGIVLCNVLFKEGEAVPANVDKKRNILSAILRNLDAPFSGGKSIIAGANLTYTPIDLSKQANAYRTEQGFFGDKAFTFKDLPTGKQNFAGVRYSVYDFATSPIPTIIELGGANIPGNLPDEVKGIPVNQKADALFFLQTARIDAPRNGDEVKQNKQFEMARYVVHYADGQPANVPVYSEINVAGYKQTAPALAIPGAQIAWTRPYDGTDQVAVAYSMQWNNPRPDVAITSVDFQYGADKRGVPALLAITAASAQ